VILFSVVYGPCEAFDRKVSNHFYKMNNADKVESGCVMIEAEVISTPEERHCEPRFCKGC